MSNWTHQSTKERVSLVTTNVLKSKICDYVLKSIPYFRHDYVPVGDSFLLHELPQPIKVYIDHHFLENRSIWIADVLYYKFQNNPG